MLPRRFKVRLLLQKPESLDYGAGYLEVIIPGCKRWGGGGRTLRILADELPEIAFLRSRCGFGDGDGLGLGLGFAWAPQVGTIMAQPLESPKSMILHTFGVQVVVRS